MATLLNTIYRDGFLTCPAVPCASANVQIPGGNRIPGIACGSLFVALNWAPPTGLCVGVEARYVTSVFVNDATSDIAPRYASPPLPGATCRSAAGSSSASCAVTTCSTAGVPAR